MVRLLNSAEVPGATVIAHFRALDHEAVTDREGYFKFNIALERRLEREVEIDLRLIAPRAAESGPIIARASVCVPPASARFGVISDIDDTIVWTHVGNRRRMLWTLARSNAATRKPLDGVAALYRAWHDGVAGDEGNPVFYVSSGPWNLYPPLIDFLRINGVPRGPVFMRDWGEHTFREWRDHGTHKLASIREIMTAFDHLPFILVGDSGEHTGVEVGEVDALLEKALRERDCIAFDVTPFVELANRAAASLPYARAGLGATEPSPGSRAWCAASSRS